MRWYRWKFWIFAWSLNGDGKVTDSHAWHRALGNLMIRGGRVARPNKHERAYSLLRELSKWDHMATAGDGPYWLGEIAKVLEDKS